MSAFVLQGSKGGIGRTTSGVMLATGLASIGLQPIHLQITMSGASPVIATVKGLPFSAVSLPEDQATLEAIRQIIAAHPQCTTIVIDMPKQTTRGFNFLDLKTAVLFPMRRAPFEIEAAIRDYRDLQDRLKVFDGLDGVRRSRRYSGWLLPVGWPQSHTANDLALSVARFDTSTRSGLSPPPILTPGIPELPRDDLDDLINGTSFRCSPIIADAAVSIARAATELSR